MKRSLTISFIAHAIALALGLVAISARPMDAPPVVSLPVQFISEKDFSQLTQGVKDAPKLKVDEIKPLADQVDKPKPAEQNAPKVAKQEVKTETVEAKPQPKPDPQPADKPDKAKAPEYKPDQIADLLKKDQPKPPPKPDNKVAPEKPQPKFDANRVAALLDKRDPQRQMATAETLNNTANLGSAAGSAAQLSQSEIDALRARISSCWSPPPGITASTKIRVSLRVLLKPDASLAQEPVLVEASASALGPALYESAKRALLLCQPFTMLRPEHYEQWKDLQLDFNPQELLGG
jgi:outer membrane biosynthesis protein TonB